MSADAALGQPSYFLTLILQPRKTSALTGKSAAYLLGEKLNRARCLDQPAYCTLDDDHQKSCFC
jgi:hypothetical protein